MGRRRATKAPSKRRWLRYGIVVGLLLLFVIVYETGQQLRRSGTGTEQQAATPSAEETVDPEDTVRRIKSYYRSHDLPSGWEVGDTARADAGAVEVQVFFAPGIRSTRHGEAARAGEIGPHNACPTEESDLWSEIAERTVEIEVNDKTGVIDRFACTPPHAGRVRIALPSNGHRIDEHVGVARGLAAPVGDKTHALRLSRPTTSP